MTPFVAADWLPLLPQIWLAGLACVLLLAGAFFKPTIAADRIVIGTLFGYAGALFLLQMVPPPAQGTLLSLPRLEIGGWQIGQSLSSFMAQAFIIITAGLAAVIATSLHDRRRTPLQYEFYLLQILSVIGMGIMVMARDLLTLYMGLELMSFALYILTAFYRDDARSSEAGLKYFVLGSIASGVLLLGMSYLYGVAGGTDYTTIYAALSVAEPSNLAIAAMVLVLVAIAFKLSVVPFHLWTPDVYEGAPTPVTAFLATTPKIAGFVLLINLLHEPFRGLADIWQPLLALLAVLTMLLGSVVAIVQTSIKRLLAYSSIGQVGFILTGVITGTVTGYSGVLFYLAVYSITILLLFGVVVLLYRREGPITEIADLAGLGKTNPGLAVMLLLGLFSLAGVPPLAGFFGKFLVFSAAVAAGWTWLAVIGVLASVIAAFYSLWLVKLVFFDETDRPLYRRDDQIIYRTLILLSLAVIGLGILPGALLEPVQLSIGAIF